jgi:hypothetical protein
MNPRPPRARRNSDPPPGPARSVTIQMARNAGLGVAQRTVTASSVRGYTQADPTQRPTIYFSTPGGQADGRATQEHPHADNVGGHMQHDPELYFQNVPRAVLRLVDQRLGGLSRTQRAVLAAYHDNLHPSPAHAPRQLVEVFHDGTGRPTGSHRSRAPFQDLTHAGGGEARAQALENLRSGPLNVNSLSRLPGGSGASDDWHVRQTSIGRHRMP